jgi:hypothetical protein
MPGRRVKYQERQRPEEWLTFHLQVREDEYEYLLDLRKLCKMSVSLLLAYAVRKYLGRVLETIGTDNYQFKNYLIIRDIFNGVICWRLFWGFPPHLDQLFISRE